MKGRRGWAQRGSPERAEPRRDREEEHQARGRTTGCFGTKTWGRGGVWQHLLEDIDSFGPALGHVRAAEAGGRVMPGKGSVSEWTERDEAVGCCEPWGRLAQERANWTGQMAQDREALSRASSIRGRRELDLPGRPAASGGGKQHRVKGGNYWRQQSGGGRGGLSGSSAAPAPACRSPNRPLASQ